MDIEIKETKIKIGTHPIYLIDRVGEHLIADIVLKKTIDWKENEL